MDLHLPELSEIGKIITCTVEGIVDEDDLRILTSGVAPAVADPEGAMQKQLEEADDPHDLRRVREKHHSVARLIAGGMSQSLVANLSGYTESYLSILLNNPAMHELVEMYRLQQGSAVAVITEKLRTVGLRATERLTDRIDANELNNNELIQAAKLGLDRAGHGPTSTQRNVNETHVLDHAKLAELNRRARAESREYIVPVEEVRTVLQLEQQPERNSDLED